MYFVLFVLLMIIMVVSIIKSKNDLKSLEYHEWMTSKGFIKVNLILFSDEDFCYKSPCIVNKDYIIGYIHSGVYSFVIGKNTYTDIAVYPERPTDAKDIKKTAPFVINTGAVKSVEKLD